MNKERIFLRTLSEWPLFVTFWGVLILGEWVASGVIGGVVTLAYHALNPGRETFSDIVAFGYSIHYLYKAFALYAVYITRKNTSNPRYSKLIIWFIASYIVWHYLMLEYGLMVGLSHFRLFMCLNVIGCYTWP